jgi:hypothetical protein
MVTLRRVLLTCAAFAALCSFGFFAGYAASQTTSQEPPTTTTETQPPPPPPDDPPPPPDDPPPPPPNDHGGGGGSTPPSTDSLSNNTDSAGSKPAKPKRNQAKPDRKKPKTQPIVYKSIHPPRDVPVFLPASETPRVSPSGRAFSISTDPSSGSSTPALAKLIAAVTFALALLLIGIAAIPDWVVRQERAALVITQWRVQIAATGISALFAAVVVVLLGSSNL